LRRTSRAQLLRMLTQTDPLYEQADVVRLTEIASSTLQNWVNRGAIRLKNAKPGKTKNRKYSGRDVATIYITRALAKVSVDLKRAASLANTSMKLFEGEADRRGYEAVGKRLREYVVVWEPYKPDLNMGSLRRPRDLQQLDMASGPFIVVNLGYLLGILISSLQSAEESSDTGSALRQRS
jgi:hypothetical protein